MGRIFGPSLRTKLIGLLIAVMLIPLLVSSWTARENARSLGTRVSNRTSSMTQEMRESVTTVGRRTTNDAIHALELLSREKIERLSTDLAREIAAFLYDRDDDLRLAAELPLTEESFRNFLACRTREVVDHGPWKLAPDKKSWVPVTAETKPQPNVFPVLVENRINFHYRPPDIVGIRQRRPLYLEMTFVDLDGMEKLKITTSELVPDRLLDVSRKENTYCRAETYFQELSSLEKGEMYVSSVIGPYVSSRVEGLYVPKITDALGIAFAPKRSGYAGRENPVGARFKGLIRWATPVYRGVRKIGYVTLALNHTHLMNFTNPLIPNEERTSVIPDASTGNYAFMADYIGRIIAHPRQYHIVGFDPRTGKRVPPWLDEETYTQWKRSGKEFEDFAKDFPEYHNPSLQKSRSLDQAAAGRMGLDYRYLNFAPQCQGFQTITQHGGSGSFRLFWSGLWKLNATAAIPYFTGQYGSQPRGFGHVAITTNVQEFRRPILATKKFIDEYITGRDADLAHQQDELYRTISQSVAEGIRKLTQSTGLMVVIVIGMATWIGTALRNRVATVTQGVREFQEGNLKHRLDVKSRDELGQLSKAFNQMARSIETSYGELSRSEHRFKAIFNQTFQLAGFLSPDGTLLAANTALQQFLGAKASELVGKACWTLPWWSDSPERQQEVREAVRKAAAGGFLRFEANGRSPLGATHYYDFSLKPFEDDEGNVVNLVLEARDITQLKEAEHELRRHRDQLELLVRDRTRDLTSANEQLHREILDREQAEYQVRAERDRAKRYLDIAGAIIVMIDARHQTALINKKGCEVLGYDEEELIGRDWFDLVFPEEDRQTQRALFDQLPAKGSESVEYVETTVLTKNRVPLTIAWQHTVLTDTNGRPVGSLSSGVDITQRKKKEQELRRARDAAEVANRTKSIFLANISHEIRTPLNAILGFCQLMLRDPSITRKQRENVGTINRSGEHLLALINEVLEMSKIESGRIALNRGSFDLNRLLEDVELMFRLRTESKGLQFEVSRSSKLPNYVVGDQSKIRQVLINLLGNAVKFTEQGGVVLRIFEENGDGCEAEDNGGPPRAKEVIDLVLEVEDTGVGIRAQDVERVFDPFEQAGKDNGSDGGTGLGLAICREYVKVMGGDITVKSQAGQGSVFRVAIPMQKGSAQACTRCDRRRRVVGLRPGLAQYRILVVDDIKTNRDILSTLLGAVGFSVRTADDGKQAVSTFRQWQPHAILMDMKMPVMDGRQAAKTIRALPGGRRAAIIAVSAGALEEERKTVLADDGPSDFIRKPFREEDVFDVLHKHLGLEYVYEEYREPAEDSSLLKRNPQTLTPDTLADFPPQLIEDLYEAALSLDIDCLNELLVNVRQLNHQAAETISTLMQRYELEVLIEALRVTEERP